MLATHYGTNAYVVEINPEETVLSERADESIRASASEILPGLLP
jgi:hypothetical protein